MKCRSENTISSSFFSLCVECIYFIVFQDFLIYNVLSEPVSEIKQKRERVHETKSYSTSSFVLIFLAKVVDAMAFKNFVRPAIWRFHGHYDHWSILMENFLKFKEYWQIVESGVVEPAAGMSMTDAGRADFERQQLKDLNAKNYLFQAIDHSILKTILCKDTSKIIWDFMKKKYKGSTRAKRQQLQTLCSQFEMLRMKLGESVTDYFAGTMAIVKKMRIHDEQMEDITIIEKILVSMTP